MYFIHCNLGCAPMLRRYIISDAEYKLWLVVHSLQGSGYEHVTSVHMCNRDGYPRLSHRLPLAIRTHPTYSIFCELEVVAKLNCLLAQRMLTLFGRL